MISDLHEAEGSSCSITNDSPSDRGMPSQCGWCVAYAVVSAVEGLRVLPSAVKSAPRNRKFAVGFLLDRKEGKTSDSVWVTIQVWESNLESDFQNLGAFGPRAFACSTEKCSSTCVWQCNGRFFSIDGNSIASNPLCRSGSNYSAFGGFVDGNPDKNQMVLLQDASWWTKPNRY